MNIYLTVVILLAVAILVTVVSKYILAKCNKEDVQIEEIIRNSAFSVIERAIYTAVVSTNEEFVKLFKGTDEWNDEKKEAARQLSFDKVMSMVNNLTLDVMEDETDDLSEYIKNRILATVNDINAQSPWK